MGRVAGRIGPPGTHSTLTKSQGICASETGPTRSLSLRRHHFEWEPYVSPLQGQELPQISNTTQVHPPISVLFSIVFPETLKLSLLPPRLPAHLETSFLLSSWPHAPPPPSHRPGPFLELPRIPLNPAQPRETGRAHSNSAPSLAALPATHLPRPR